MPCGVTPQSEDTKRHAEIGAFGITSAQKTFVYLTITFVV